MTKTEFLTMFNCNPMDTLVLVGKTALAAVTQNGYVLRYVKDQTPEIALAAVTQNGYVLQYVKDQTPEIALAAVTQDWDALRYVNLDIFED